jgi:hypothetical protein
VDFIAAAKFQVLVELLKTCLHDLLFIVVENAANKLTSAGMRVGFPCHKVLVDSY